MTAICPAGPPKVCREMANHALVASRSGITSWECCGVSVTGCTVVAPPTKVK